MAVISHPLLPAQRYLLTLTLPSKCYMTIYQDPTPSWLSTPSARGGNAIPNGLLASIEIDVAKPSSISICGDSTGAHTSAAKEHALVACNSMHERAACTWFLRYTPSALDGSVTVRLGLHGDRSKQFPRPFIRTSILCWYTNPSIALALISVTNTANSRKNGDQVSA